MKSLLTFITLAILFWIFSCDWQEKQMELPLEQGITERMLKDYRLPTEAELRGLERKGFTLSSSKTVTCQWSGGQGGSINCNGGTCRVILYNPTNQACLGCFINGELSHAGACIEQPD